MASLLLLGTNTWISRLKLIHEQRNANDLGMAMYVR